MLPNVRTVQNVGLFLTKRKAGSIVQSPPKYTLDDWEANSNLKFRIMKDQEKLVERIYEESIRTIDEVTVITKEKQLRVEHLTKERIEEVRYLSNELKKQKKAVMLELETLSTFLNRVKSGIEFLKDKSLPICQQCMIWRDSRIGVELCDDEVDHQLRCELKTVKGCQQLLDKTYKETAEQIRKLRAIINFLDFDLEQKEKAQFIDEKNNTLKQTYHLLGQGVDLTAWRCGYSLDDWFHEAYRNLSENAKEIAFALDLRSYIETLLIQICRDMRDQTERTNAAFERRIREVKNLKRTLEDKHSKTTASILNVQEIILTLELEIADKERAMLLCKTRLSHRTRRPGIELTCDLVHESLLLELNALQATMCKLNQKLTENKALLRYLLHVQIMQEEEITLKTNDIKIDECDCITLRQALVYTYF